MQCRSMDQSSSDGQQLLWPVMTTLLICSFEKMSVNANGKQKRKGRQWQIKEKIYITANVVWRTKSVEQK